MMYPGRKASKLDMALFRKPTAHYRGVPFWAWNCRITEELIDKQLDVFKEMGFGGVDIHPRSGLDTAYLSDEFMHMIRHAADKCREKGLFCWLYDDDRFPSGAADGIVTRDWRFRQRYLLLTEDCQESCCPDRAAFDREIASGGQPAGYYIASYAVVLEDGYLASYRRIAQNEAPQKGEIVRHAYVMLLEPEDWFQGQTYVDVMNPEAIRRFIDVTHEAYLRHVGEHFGAAVPAIFTDEPRMETRSRTLTKQLPTPDSHSDVILPYTEGLRDQLLRDKGIDILEIAPELIWDLPEGQLSAVRYHYRDAACERFVSSFMDQIADWCAQHGILMTGHVLSEDTLASQAAALGDCMRCYRKMDLPGIDVLCDYRQFIAAKQASSVAHQYGREGVISEMYGVTQWDCDFKTYKLQGDWQAALGVTVRIPHLSWMSMEGEGKRDWPASIFYQSPWWKEYPYIEDYFARLNTVLTRGTPMIDVAVLHPVESLWFRFGPASQHAKMRSEMDNAFEAFVQRLLFDRIDFDFISESLLPEQNAGCEETLLRVGKMRYRTVVVPDMMTIRSTTLDVLEDFAAAGGQIVFLGCVPELVDAQPSDRAKRLAQRCHNTMLQSQCRISILCADGSPDTKLLMQRRQDDDCQWMFLCHAYPKNESICVQETYTLRIPGLHDLTVYDAMSGETKVPSFWHEDGYTCMRWQANHEDSLLLQLTAHDGEAVDKLPEKKLARYTTVCRLNKPVGFTRSEPNMLLLDYARAQIDDGELSHKQEILRLDNEIREKLGFKPRGEHMMQPWAMEERDAHRVTFHYDVYADVQTSCCLALERPENCRLTFNEQPVDALDLGYYVDEAIRVIRLPKLKGGANHLAVQMVYNQKTNPEAMYLLGEFDVRAGAAGESYIVPLREDILVGDLTQQGMPFYTGNAVYTFCFTAAQAGEYAVCIPEFKAPVMTVHVDGCKCGYIAYAPHRVSLGVLQAGEHELVICAYGNRHNGFGALHNANDNYVWFGHGSFRTQGKDWTDDYRVRPNGILSAVEIERVER